MAKTTLVPDPSYQNRSEKAFQWKRIADIVLYPDGLIEFQGTKALMTPLENKMKFEHKLGSSLQIVQIVKTRGQTPTAYDLYDIRGLSLGKLEVIRLALAQYASTGSILAKDMECLFQNLEEEQTIAGK